MSTILPAVSTVLPRFRGIAKSAPCDYVAGNSFASAAISVEPGPAVDLIVESLVNGPIRELGLRSISFHSAGYFMSMH